MERGQVVGYFCRNERFITPVATSWLKLISVKLEVLVSRLQHIYLRHLKGLLENPLPDIS